MRRIDAVGQLLLSGCILMHVPQVSMIDVVQLLRLKHIVLTGAPNLVLDCEACDKNRNAGKLALFLD